MKTKGRFDRHEHTNMFLLLFLLLVNREDSISFHSRKKDNEMSFSQHPCMVGGPRSGLYDQQISFFSFLFSFAHIGVEKKKRKS